MIPILTKKRRPLLGRDRDWPINIEEDGNTERERPRDPQRLCVFLENVCSHTQPHPCGREGGLNGGSWSFPCPACRTFSDTIQATQVCDSKLYNKGNRAELRPKNPPTVSQISPLVWALPLLRHCLRQTVEGGVLYFRSQFQKAPFPISCSVVSGLW